MAAFAVLRPPWVLLLLLLVQRFFLCEGAMAEVSRFARRTSLGAKKSPERGGVSVRHVSAVRYAEGARKGLGVSFMWGGGVLILGDSEDEGGRA